MTDFGESVDKASGATVPVNITSILPEPGKQNFTGLMNLSYMQFFSKQFGVVVGKLYTLGADDNAFAHDFRSTFLYTGLMSVTTLLLARIVISISCLLCWASAAAIGKVRATPPARLQAMRCGGKG